MAADREGVPDDRKRGWRLPDLTLDRLWLIFPVVILVILSFHHSVRLLDFWWHLKVGQIIVETMSLPRVDMFSFTVPGTEFILQNWLTETIYYLLFRLGKLELLIAIHTLLLVASFIPIYHLCWEATQRVRLAVFSSGITLLALAAYANARPQIVSFLLFACFYWSLVRFCQGRRSYLWFLPMLMAFWVNLHGAFVLGLGLIAIHLFSESMRRLVLGSGHQTLSATQLGILSAVFCLSLGATLLNPEGPGVFEYVVGVLQDPGSQLFVTEWKPPNIKSLPGVVFFFGPFFVTLPIMLFSSRKLRFTEFCLFVVFGVFALSALRNGIWFSMIISPIVARMLTGTFVAETTRSPFLTRIISQNVGDGGSGNPFMNWVILLVFLTGAIVSSPWLFPRFFQKPIWQEETPVSAMDFLEEQALSGNIFHSQIYGDYLVWRLWPKQRSLIDGRMHIFGEDLARDYLATFSDTCWERRLEKWKIRYLLLRKNDKLLEGTDRIIQEARTSENWQAIYEDELCIIFEKAAPG